jgi:hypothetical protein
LFSAGGGIGVADGAGVGGVDAAGAGVGLAAGGDCASAGPGPNEIRLSAIAATGTSANNARRKQRVEFIQYSPSPMAAQSLARLVPALARKSCHF